MKLKMIITTIGIILLIAVGTAGIIAALRQTPNPIPDTKGLKTNEIKIYDVYETDNAWLVYFVDNLGEVDSLEIPSWGAYSLLPPDTKILADEYIKEQVLYYIDVKENPPQEKETGFIESDLYKENLIKK